MKLLLAAASLVALVPTAAQAQSTPATRPPVEMAGPGPVTPERVALGVQLAKLLNPAAGVESMLDRMMSDSMPRALMLDPAMQELEKAYPGVVDVMVDAMRPVLQRRMRETMPEMWDLLGNHYAARLDSADLRAAIAFYGSPTGDRIVAGMVAGVSFDSMLEGMVRDDQFEVGASEVNSTMRAGARKTYAELSAEDRAAAVRFGISPAGRRIVAANQSGQPIILEWANRPDPAFEAELQDAMLPALEKHTGLKLGPVPASTPSKSKKTP